MKRVLFGSLVLSQCLFAVTPYIQPVITQNGNHFDSSITQYSNNYQNGLTYTWVVTNMNNGKTANYGSDKPYISIDATGFYKIVVTAKNSLGESYSTTQYKNVTALSTVILDPIPGFTVASTATSITVNLTSQNETKNSIQIKKDGVFYVYDYAMASTIRSKTYSDLKPGSYWIQVESMNASGIVKMTNQTIVIKEAVVAPVQTVNPNQPNYTLGTPTANVGTVAAKYSKQITLLNAQAAYDQGWTGKGVSVAVIDTGVNNNTATFGNRVEEAAAFYTGTQTATTGDSNGHGTFVASIIAADRTDKYLTGIAFDSKIVAVQAFNGSSGSFDSIFKSIKYVGTRSDVKVANVSLGGNYITSAFLQEAKDMVIPALQNGQSFVIAAGNDGLSCTPDASGNLNGKCNMLAALPSISGMDAMSTSNGAWIVVGSVDDKKVLSTFSNKAGVTKDYYMVAYGNSINGLYGNTYATGSGTSFAAPEVTAAFALLAQKYPYLTGRQIQDILLSTADDLGAAGVDDVYGHGLLNIGTAMKPIGELKITSSKNLNTANIAKYGISSTSISGTTASNGFLKALSGKMENVAAFDNYNRQFNVDLSSSVSTSKARSGFDFSNYQIIDPTPGQPLYVGVDQSTQDAIIALPLGENFKLFYGHDNKYLGLEGQGALGITGSTDYVGLEAGIDIDQVRLEGMLSYGRSKGSAPVDSMLSNASTTSLIGYELMASWNGFSLGVKRDLMPINGAIDVLVPTSRTMEGDVVTSSEKVALKSGLAEDMQLATRYTTMLTKDVRFDVSYYGGNDNDNARVNFTYSF